MYYSPDIEWRVRSIIVEKLNVDEAEIEMNASFVNDLGADSLDAVELIMEFEKEFGINIPDEVAERIVTVGDAICYIEDAGGSIVFDECNEEETFTYENETEYLNELKDVLSEGEISPRERRLLDKIRIQLGISEERAAELEASLSTSGVSAEEQEYMDELQDILKGGGITPRDQKFLDKLKKVNNISDLRACQLEKMVENNLCQGKAKYGSSDASCLKGISKSHS